ncbi:MAG: putative toxin-antitoxin system antitoxin component (TIGR02293 family) [Cyclobacteriaceae bacterium]
MKKSIKPYATPSSFPSKVEEAAMAYDTPVKKILLSRSGLSTHFVLDLMASYQFSKQEISRLANISTKTLERHLQSGRMFSGLQSDRLLELAELYHEGIALFGSREKFLKWLNAKIPALGDTAPKEWLDTHHGIAMISDELGRIQHGIFA